MTRRTDERGGEEEDGGGEGGEKEKRWKRTAMECNALVKFPHFDTSALRTLERSFCVPNATCTVRFAKVRHFDMSIL